MSDLRVLDRTYATRGAILVRDKCIVVVLEHVRLIVMRDCVLLPLDRDVALSAPQESLVAALERQIHDMQAPGSTNGDVNGALPSPWWRRGPPQVMRACIERPCCRAGSLAGVQHDKPEGAAAQKENAASCSQRTPLQRACRALQVITCTWQRPGQQRRSAGDATSLLAEGAATHGRAASVGSGSGGGGDAESETGWTAPRTPLEHVEVSPFEHAVLDVALEQVPPPSRSRTPPLGQIMHACATLLCSRQE